MQTVLIVKGLPQQASEQRHNDLSFLYGKKVSPKKRKQLERLERKGICEDFKLSRKRIILVA